MGNLKRYHLVNPVSYFLNVSWNKFLTEGNFQNGSIPCLWGSWYTSFSEWISLFSCYLSKTLLFVNIAFFKTALPHWDVDFSVGSFRNMTIELDKSNEGKYGQQCNQVLLTFPYEHTCGCRCLGAFLWNLNLGFVDCFGNIKVVLA